MDISPEEIDELIRCKRELNKILPKLRGKDYGSDDSNVAKITVDFDCNTQCPVDTTDTTDTDLICFRWPKISIAKLWKKIVDY